MSPYLTTLLALTIFCSSPALAEIEKFATNCEGRICFHWWPALPQVTGWRHDRKASLAHGINTQIPNRVTFASADAVIYAMASYKPRMPETASLSDLIARDQKDFLGVTRTTAIPSGIAQIRNAATGAKARLQKGRNGRSTALRLLRGQ